MEIRGGLSISWEKPEDLSDFEPDTRVVVPVVLDVTGVPVSPSSVVTEFCEVFSVAQSGKLWSRVHIVVQLRRKR